MGYYWILFNLNLNSSEGLGIIFNTNAITTFSASTQAATWQTDRITGVL